MVLVLAQLLLKPLHRGVSLEVGHGCSADAVVLAVVVTVLAVPIPGF